MKIESEANRTPRTHLYEQTQTAAKLEHDTSRSQTSIQDSDMSRDSSTPPILSHRDTHDARMQGHDNNYSSTLIVHTINEDDSSTASSTYTMPSHTNGLLSHIRPNRPALVNLSTGRHETNSVFRTVKPLTLSETVTRTRPETPTLIDKDAYHWSTKFRGEDMEADPMSQIHSTSEPS